MKKTLTVLMMVLLAATLIISCDNSTSEPKAISYDELIGTWIYGDKLTGTDLDYISLVFNADNTVFLKEGKGNTDTEYSGGADVTVSGSTITITFSEDDVWNYSAEFKGGKLVLKQVGDATWLRHHDMKEITLDRYYTVTFNSNGGSSVKALTVKSGETVSKPADLKIKNAVFKYWSKDGTTEFSFDTPITENTTLTAIWQTTFQIGDTGPAGGIIFYVANTEQTSTYGTETFKWKYLEATPSDATYYNASTFSWGDNGSFGTGTAIGDGWVNAKKFAADTTESALLAAQVCFAYGNDTDYDDWFLPSKYELKAMYDNIGSTGTWSFLYWSSSENGANAAVAKYFQTGYGNTEGFDNFQRNGSSVQKLAVRPVRAFAEVTTSSSSGSSSSGS